MKLYDRLSFTSTWLLGLCQIVLCGFATADDQISPKQERPNILWITIEDWSPDLSCYGTKGIQTPHVDKLASEGIRYETAFTTECRAFWEWARSSVRSHRRPMREILEANGKPTI